MIVLLIKVPDRPVQYFHSFQDGKAQFTGGHRKAYRFGSISEAQRYRERKEFWKYVNQFDEATVSIGLVDRDGTFLPAHQEFLGAAT